MNDERTIIEQAADLDTANEVLGRLCQTDEELSAVKRALGVDAQEARLTNAFSPELPPEPVFQPNIDHLTHARRTAERYAEWVESFPDDDPTPLDERTRILTLAEMDVRRLGNPEP